MTTVPYMLKALTFFASSGCPVPIRRETRLPPPIPKRLDSAAFIISSVSVREAAAIM